MCNEPAARRAATFVMLALTGCMQVAARQGCASNGPYSDDYAWRMDRERWTRASGPQECVDKMKSAPLPRQMYSTLCYCWTHGVVGEAPASSKRSGKSTGHTSAAHTAAGNFVDQSLVRSALVVKAESLADATARLESIGIGFQNGPPRISSCATAARQRRCPTSARGRPC